MIAFLDGIMAGKSHDACLVDVGGVGYRVVCSAATVAQLPAEGDRVRIWTHTHVREDTLALFGFASEAEQRLFELSMVVSGVGPKVALQICSAFTPEGFRRAIATDDVAALSSVPGLGKKTAQRLVLELKEKLALPDLQVVGSAPVALSQVRSALENLGYSAPEIRAALGEVDPAPDASVEDLVKSALKVLA
ncbi:MAG TPA: Holliday junction branch migration protein RuvA [Actinomycetota bacterium]|nr:Holliday junction branch migration protein RuvA [Actinomycetota bacterium]